MKIAIDVSTFRVRRIALGLLIVSVAAIAFVSRIGGAVAMLVSIVLVTRADEYIVFRRRDEVLRRIQKPLELLDFPYSIDHSAVTITRPPMRLRVISLGLGYLLSFRFPQPPSARERYTAATLVKYQRTIRKS